MASIERTAYPLLKNTISQKELEKKYILSTDEINHAHLIARGKASISGYLVLLKCFQNVGYFPAIDEIPDIIIKYIKSQLDTDYHFITLL